ncbi:MAG: 3-phosphoshikimate 1-carboxyvinyltransferase [bacterium]
MNMKINKTEKLAGNVTPPSSKSQSIRALFIATLAGGKSVLNNVLESDDTKAAKNVCRGLGAKLTESKENGQVKIEVESDGAPLENSENRLFADNSGVTTRLVMPVLGLRKNFNEKIILDCGEQMRKRLVQSLISALNNLGMNVVSQNNNGTCPLEVFGKLLGGKTEVDGVTSQFLSALLLSLPCAENDSEIMVKNLQEKPYVEMTLAWLDEQKIKYEHIKQNNTDIYKVAGKQKYHTFEKAIPADFSSASYLIAAAVLIDGEVEIGGMDMTEHQGDKRLVYILQEMGADIKIDSVNNALIIKGAKPLKGMKIDANDIPDMVPTLAVVGTRADGETEIYNVAHARIKETDRIHSMTQGLTKMGAAVIEKPDGLIVRQSSLRGIEVHGFEDHRTVMSLALAGLMAEGETTIDTAESINKTFPAFVEKMNDIGAKIEIV